MPQKHAHIDFWCLSSPQFSSLSVCSSNPASSAAQTPNSAQLNQITWISLGVPSLIHFGKNHRSESQNKHSPLLLEYFISCESQFCTFVWCQERVASLILFISILGDGENASKEFLQTQLPCALYWVIVTH